MTDDKADKTVDRRTVMKATAGSLAGGVFATSTAAGASCSTNKYSIDETVSPCAVAETEIPLFGSCCGDTVVKTKGGWCGRATCECIQTDGGKHRYAVEIPGETICFWVRVADVDTGCGPQEAGCEAGTSDAECTC